MVLLRKTLYMTMICLAGPMSAISVQDGEDVQMKVV